MKLPLVPTVMVAISVPILIALGIWQLGRADEKAAMLAALAASPDLPTIAVEGDQWDDGLDFRRIRTQCRFTGTAIAKAGRSAARAAGYSYFAQCAPAGSSMAVEVNLGWDSRPDRDVALREEVQQLPMTGIVRRDRSKDEDVNAIPYVLIAMPPLADLAQSRIPTTEDIPDNHMAYAVQWFGFAVVLSIIYIVYVRGWRRARQDQRRDRRRDQRRRVQ